MKYIQLLKNRICKVYNLATIFNTLEQVVFCCLFFLAKSVGSCYALFARQNECLFVFANKVFRQFVWISMETHFILSDSGILHQLREIHSICKCCWKVAIYTYKLWTYPHGTFRDVGLAVSVKSFISCQWNKCLEHSHQTCIWYWTGLTCITKRARIVLGNLLFVFQKSLLNMNNWASLREEEYNLVLCCDIRIKPCSVRLYLRLFVAGLVLCFCVCLYIIMSNILQLFILLVVFDVFF